jgi:hypothetical protein
MRGVGRSANSGDLSLPVDTVEAPFSLPHSFQHPSSVLALRANPPSPTRGEGRGALHHRHARFSPSGYCQRTLPIREEVVREAGRLAEPSETKIHGATSAPRRRFLSPPVPLRESTVTALRLSASPPSQAMAHHHRLCRSHLCAPPARRDHSVPRGITGRSLPGPMASSAMERRRRSFPAFERLRSVPGRKDEWIMREGRDVCTKRRSRFRRKSFIFLI